MLSTGEYMRFLVLSDIHGDTAYLNQLDEEFSKADIVLIAGDFARCGEAETGLFVLNALIEKHENLFCVLGNCDEPSFIEELEKYDVSVQSDVVFCDGLAFSGSGGSLRFTGVTPFERTDDELIKDLHMVSEQDNWDNLMLLIHHPPFNTKLDVISVGSHVGSPAVRSFIEKHQPLVVISGHIHESFAIDTLGSSLLINPGSLAEGRYAILVIERVNGRWGIVCSELKKIG